MLLVGFQERYSESSGVFGSSVGFYWSLVNSMMDAEEGGRTRFFGK